MIGPVALVKDKTKKSYGHLFKALVAEEPSLAQDVKACGSDGEINLEKVLDSNFPQAYRIRCTLHLFNDIREKAKQIGLPRAKVECSIEELRNVCLTTSRESGAQDLGAVYMGRASSGTRAARFRRDPVIANISYWISFCVYMETELARLAEILLLVTRDLASSAKFFSM